LDLWNKHYKYLDEVVYGDIKYVHIYILFVVIVRFVSEDDLKIASPKKKGKGKENVVENDEI
jgi:hypothetical protein